MKRNTVPTRRSKAKRQATLIVLDPPLGSHIEEVCKEACALAINKQTNVNFTFNGKDVTATPKDSWLKVLKRWNPEYDPVKASIYPATAKEALRRWDSGQSVFTVEMGGLGPGYEQAIHILVFEIIRDNLRKKLPKPGESSNGWADKTVSRINKSCGGFSGAQVGAAKNLAYHYLNDGYEATIKQFDNEKDRTIQVSTAWPKSK